MVSRKQRPQLLVAAHLTDARGRILVARHATHWLWHLPDGDVRFGETMHDALLRSFNEDFGRRLTVLSSAPWLVTETIGDTQRMHFVTAHFRAELRENAVPLKPRDGIESLWLEPAAVEAMAVSGHTVLRSTVQALRALREPTQGRLT